MPDEPIESQDAEEQIERQDIFVKGGREIKMYTNVKSGAVRFEGFMVFERSTIDPFTGMNVVRRFPVDFDIDAVAIEDAFDKFDARGEEVLEELRGEHEDSQVEAPEGAKKLIHISGGG